MKIRRLGLEVVDRRKKIVCSTTTAELVLPVELFSVEEVLRELHAAVDKTEVIRLRESLQAAKCTRRCLLITWIIVGLRLSFWICERNMRFFQRPRAFQPNQLLEARFALLVVGGLAFSHPQGSLDDVFWASMLAVYATCEMTPEPFLAVVPM